MPVMHTKGAPAAVAHGPAAVVATAAVGWRLLGRAASLVEAEDAAAEMWRRRDRGRFG
jgi:hypothetical protein